MTDKNRFFTVEELAQHIKVHRVTVRRWIKEGKLIALKLGNGPAARYRISEKEATAFLNRLAAGLTARGGEQTVGQPPERD